MILILEKDQNKKLNSENYKQYNLFIRMRRIKYSYNEKKKLENRKMDF